jgi:outer membrane beta-barrel protein
MGAYASTSTREVTDDLLKDPNKISTDNVVTSRGFAVAAFKWNPIYGKITWLNKTIVPFDLNFNIGGGVTFLANNDTAPTLHLGTSQVFALSKGMAFRWDLIWNAYQASVTEATTKAKSTLSQNDLFLGLGMSFYFPEAKYR